jgi:hypothetical protein
MPTQATAVLVQRALATARHATDPEEYEEISTLLAQAAADGPGSLLLGRDLLHVADPAERRTGCDLLRLTSELHSALQPDAATELVALAASEQDLRVLGRLARALGATCDTRALPVLLTLAGHRDAQVRLQVAVALPTVAIGEPDRPALHTLIRLTRDTDPEVRNWATFGLGFQLEADSPAIRAALWDRTSDDNAEAREEGIRGLARRHDPGAVPLLAQLLDDPRGAHVHSLMAAAILGSPELLPHLEGYEPDGSWVAEAVTACDPRLRTARDTFAWALVCALHQRVPGTDAAVYAPRFDEGLTLDMNTAAGPLSWSIGALLTRTNGDPERAAEIVTVQATTTSH